MEEVSNSNCSFSASQDVFISMQCEHTELQRILVELLLWLTILSPLLCLVCNHLNPIPTFLKTFFKHNLSLQNGALMILLLKSEKFQVKTISHYDG